MNRVKFYSKTDLSTGWYFERLSKIINFPDEEDYNSLLNILEITNVLKFIDNKMYPDNIDDVSLKISQKIFRKKIHLFFNDCNKEDIADFFKYIFSAENSAFSFKSEKLKEDISLDSHSKYIFREDFIECIEKYKLKEKIDEESLEIYIKEYSIPIVYFLESEYFIKAYPQLMKLLFLNESENIEILIQNYTLETSKHFIPKNILKGEMYTLCEEYIANPNTNLNYLRIISKGIQGLKEMNIDAKLKLNALNRINEIENDLFLNENGEIKKGHKVSLAVFVDEYEYLKSKVIFKTHIDVQFIESNNSPEILLGYSMYLNFYFTNNWILDLCSFPNLESTTLMRSILGTKTRNHYETSFYFENKNALMLYTLRGFHDVLKEKLNLRIEDLITYYFSKTSKVYFHINWIPFHFASEGEKLEIQIKNIFTIEENLRKQWKILLEDGLINPQLVELDSTPSVETLASKLEKKYIYSNEENNLIDNILHLLFSDQSGLCYINEETQDKNFFNLILQNKISKSNLNERQMNNTEFLLANKMLSINQEGRIYLKDKQLFKLLILRNIYNYGVVHYHHHLLKKIGIEKDLLFQQMLIDEMIENGLLIFENRLFSRPEAEYLNYVLNKSKHDNALALRNKYLHGSATEANYEDYYSALLILLTYTIKINDELEIAETE